MRDGWRIFSQNLVEDHRRAFARQIALAGRHFVEHRAEAEQVRAGVHVFAARLLGRHVGHRAHGHAGTGEMVFVQVRCGRGRITGILAMCFHGRDARATGQFCQVEFENLWLAERGDKNIRRLDVAMRDALLVRGVQRVGNLDG